MKRHSSAIHTALSVFIISITIIVGWFTQRFSTAIDITANDRHSLAQSTQQVLQSLNAPVELIAVLGPNPQQRSAVQSLITRFQEIKPDITLSFINPETDPAQARNLNAAPGGELILRAGDREQRLQTLSERNLTNSLQQLGREGLRRIVFIDGHEERSTTLETNDGWSLMAERLTNIGLVVAAQSLVSEPHIGDDVDLVVIAAPEHPYFPGELASINNYIQREGNILWLTEGARNRASQESLSLLSDIFGVDVLPGVVIDTASQALDADTPDFVLLDRFPEHPVNLNLTSPVLLPQASALAVTPLAGQVITPLLQTPQNSWTETGELSGEIQFDENTAEVAGPLLLAVTIERTLSAGTQRFAVIGDADFASSQFIGNGANQSFMEALALWLTGDAQELQFITQRAPDSELNLDNRSIILLSLTYLFILPLALLLLAAVVWWRRRRSG